MSPNFLRRARTRVSYANVMATIAVFIALGGTSYAVKSGSIDSREIKNNTIRSQDIRNGQVRGRDIRAGAVGSSDVKDGALLRTDFKVGELPAGPDGATGAPGARGPRGAPGATRIVVRRKDVVPQPAPSSSALAVGCGTGERLVGGGVLRVASGGGYVYKGQDAVVMNAPAKPDGSPSGEGETPAKWLSALYYFDANDAGERIRHYALCARP